jgi:hypothetical protein
MTKKGRGLAEVANDDSNNDLESQTEPSPSSDCDAYSAPEYGCFRRHYYVIRHIVRETPTSRLSHLTLRFAIVGYIIAMSGLHAFLKAIEALLPGLAWVQAGVLAGVCLCSILVFYLMMTEPIQRHLTSASAHKPGGALYDPNAAAVTLPPPAVLPLNSNAPAAANASKNSSSKNRLSMFTHDSSD